MIKPLRTQFVIADAAHARWVKHSEKADDFVTVDVLKAEDRPHGSPQGVVFEGSSGRRFTVEEADEARRAHHDAFAVLVAERINLEAAQGGFERLAVVAPARTLSAIEHHLSAEASAKLTRRLAKDLVKTPDHELGLWLRPLERG